MTTREVKKMAKANRELLHRVEELQGKVKKVKLQARTQSQKLKQQSSI